MKLHCEEIIMPVFLKLNLQKVYCELKNKIDFFI